MTTDHLPIVDAESQPFWDALADGVFLLRWCQHCDRGHFYPRVHCPHCWAEATWREASGRGTVFATTTVRAMGAPPFSERVPYDLSIVELAEGPRLLTNVVGVDPDEVVIGMPVELAPRLDSGRWMPTFRPSEA